MSTYIVAEKWSELTHPLSGKAVKFWLKEIAKNNNVPANPKARGALVGNFNKFLSDEERRKVFGWLFGKNGIPVMSSKSLDEGQIGALMAWIDSVKIDDEWVNNPYFEQELMSVLEEADSYYIEWMNKHPMAKFATDELGGIVIAVENNSSEVANDKGKST